MKQIAATSAPKKTLVTAAKGAVARQRCSFCDVLKLGRHAARMSALPSDPDYIKGGVLHSQADRGGAGRCRRRLPKFGIEVTEID